MLNVALTGNIAAGKSTVVGLFRDWGATVVDADQLVREAQAPGSQVLATIARRFGADVIASDGTLDRAALRAKVMGDDVALADLNALVHPVVRRRRDELQNEARTRGDALLVNDIPLLFEALDPDRFDAIVLVDAPVAMRRARLVERRGLPMADAERMIAAQMPAERKRPRATYVIDNDGTMAALRRKARRTFEALRRVAAPLGRPWRSLILAATDARDEPQLIKALGARCSDAGVPARRATGRAAWLRELKRSTPDAVVATPHAARSLQATRKQAPPPIYVISRTDDGTTPLDLRAWGDDRVWLAGKPLA